MDAPQKISEFDESVKRVAQSLPPVIRAYLAQGKYTTVAKNLMTKYGLRIDQGGVLEREIMLLLMGVDNPDEFTQVLVEEAKLSQQIVSGIVQDVNTQIFVPLRQEEMKSKTVATAEPMKPAVPQPQPPPQPQPRPAIASTPNYAPPRPPVASQAPGVVGPPLQSPRYFHLENKITPPAPSSRPSLREVLAAVTKEVPPPPSTEKLLEDHEEPHIDLKPIAPRITPPPNLPGMLPPRVVPPPAPSTPAKPYSGDPYREPIDEK